MTTTKVGTVEVDTGILESYRARGYSDDQAIEMISGNGSEPGTIPTDLLSYQNWVAWRSDPPRKTGEKRVKTPVNPHTGGNADSTDPNTWGTYEQAQAARLAHDLTGVGFVLTDTDLAGVDLDDCRDPSNGTIEPWAQNIVDGLQSYSEASPSKTGLKIFLRGKKPGAKCRKAYHTGEVEMYDSGRYFTVTGEHLAGTPLEIKDRQAELEELYYQVFGQPETSKPPARPATTSRTVDDKELIAKMLDGKHGTKIKALLDGDISSYPSHSEADQALCNHLAFWTDHEAAQMDRIFRTSGLYREKWERADYRNDTIQAAIDGTSEGYSPRLPGKLGAKISKKTGETIKAIRFDPPAPELRQAVAEALTERDPESKRLRPAESRREKASDVAIHWLLEHGEFCQTESDELFYFSRDTRRLYDLANVLWAAFLYALTGVNPSSVHFAHMSASCKTEAIFSERRQVVRLSHWGNDDQVLRVSGFNGTVYALDGETITEESNGEHVLFADDPLWTAYTPIYDRPGALTWLTETIPNWESDPEELRLAFRVWALSVFFTELCPSRPLCVFLGEKGSGKSMILRLLLKLLFGPSAELSGVPDRADGFTAAASSAHVLVLDNLDQFTGWLRDKLAMLATGGQDEYRKLYTSNEVGRVLYRCWLAFTSRTPDTLRRDDLADRLLILPVKRLADGDRQRENVFYQQAADRRNMFWGEVLTTCNRAVASIRAGHLGASTSRLRLADWEALGRVLANDAGETTTWDQFCERLQKSQSDFLLEGDPIVDALNVWLAQVDVNTGKDNYDREMTGRELYNELTEALFPGKRPDRDWPKSARSFSKRLGQIRRDLASLFNLEWEQGTTRATRGGAVYCFRSEKPN